MGRIVKPKVLSMRERVKARIKKRKRGRSTKYQNLPENVSWFEPSKLVMIDIIPYVVSLKADVHPDGVDEGELWWCMTYFQHTNIGSDDRTYVCPRTFHKKCPICDYRSELIKDSYEKNKEDIEALKAKERQLIQLIDVQDKKAGIQLWDVSYHLFGKQLEREIEEGEDDWADFASLDAGFTLKVRFSEEKWGKTTFYKADRIDFLEREEQYDESILEKGFQLDKILRVFEPDTLGDVFFDRISVDELLDSDEDDESDDSASESVHRTPEVRERKKEEKVEDNSASRPVRQRRAKPVQQVEDDATDDDTPPFDEGSTPSEKTEEAVEESEPTDSKSPPETTDKETSPRRRRRQRKAAEEKDDSKCPYGHKFGVECDNYDDCAECPDDVWEECARVKDLNE